MASLNVYDRSGKEVGTYQVEPTDLAPRINRQLLHDVVVMYRANKRQGSRKTKSRAEVNATTKKMYRQKGTGNARAGSRVTNIRRGGGHAFALRPRDYSYRLPRKAVQLATRMAVAAKVRDGGIVLIDQLSFEAPKTKDMTAILAALGCRDRVLLVTTAAYDPNVYKSARNIQGVTVSPAGELNALDVLNSQRMLITKEAMDLLVAKSRKEGKNGRDA